MKISHSMVAQINLNDILSSFEGYGAISCENTRNLGHKQTYMKGTKLPRFLASWTARAGQCSFLSLPGPLEKLSLSFGDDCTLILLYCLHTFDHLRGGPNLVNFLAYQELEIELLYHPETL